MDVIKYKKKEYKAKDLTYKERLEIADIAFSASESKSFAKFGKVVELTLDESEAVLNSLSMLEISEIGQLCVEYIDKGKKLVKSK